MRSTPLLLTTVGLLTLISPLNGSAYSLPTTATTSSSSSSKPLSHRALEVILRQKWQQNASSSRSSSSSSSSRSQGTFKYVPYPGNVLGNGQSALLFFCTDWSRQCQFMDKLLKEWSNNRSFIIPLYKMDYDHETALRQQYKVLHVSTFVLVDGKGAVVKLAESAPESWLQTVLYGG